MAPGPLSYFSTRTSDLGAVLCACYWLLNCIKPSHHHNLCTMPRQELVSTCVPTIHASHGSFSSNVLASSFSFLNCCDLQPSIPGIPSGGTPRVTEGNGTWDS